MTNATVGQKLKSRNERSWKKTLGLGLLGGLLTVTVSGIIVYALSVSVVGAQYQDAVDAIQTPDNWKQISEEVYEPGVFCGSPNFTCPQVFARWQRTEDTGKTLREDFEQTLKLSGIYLEVEGDCGTEPNVPNVNTVCEIEGNDEEFNYHAYITPEHQYGVTWLTVYIEPLK